MASRRSITSQGCFGIHHKNGDCPHTHRRTQHSKVVWLSLNHSSHHITYPRVPITGRMSVSSITIVSCLSLLGHGGSMWYHTGTRKKVSHKQQPHVTCISYHCIGGWCYLDDDDKNKLELPTSNKQDVACGGHVEIPYKLTQRYLRGMSAVPIVLLLVWVMVINKW